MKTSYFAKVKSLYGKNLVSIALKTPPNFRGQSYDPLAPTWEMLNGLKYEGKSEKWYIEQYQTILDKLKPENVINKLGEDAILCCWEGKDEFCHRHLVAEWFIKADYSISELE